MKMAGMKQPHPSLLLMDVVTHYLYTLSPIPQLNEALKRYHHLNFSSKVKQDSNLQPLLL